MTRQPARLIYLAALGLGVAAAAATLPVATMLGTGALWVNPGGDPAMALTGHLAYQAPGWHWPLLLARSIAWPAGRSIAMTDSNPAATLLAKLAAGAAGHPVNLLGAWLALCWVLQPVAAVFALRSFGPPPSRQAAWIGALGVATLSLLCPAWLMRFSHVNLLGHFLLLAALGLAVRLTRAPRDALWCAAAALLTAAVLVHPYLFVYAAVVLSAPVLHALLADRGGAWRTGLRYAAACVAPVLLLWVLSGSLGAKASGYGHYSMNLLSPVVPQLSGLFGATLPVIDATGGQYEGFNYQGAGVLVLAVLALALARSGAPACLPRRRAALAVMVPLLALTALALSPRVYAGQWLVLPLPLWPWNRLAASVQSSGRAFWVVGYAVMIASVARLAARLRPAALLAVLAAAIVLQAIDTAPMRARAAPFFAGRDQTQPPFAMPDGATLLRVVPACDPVTATADLLRLVAVRHAMRLADMRMARQPDGFDCETALSDGLESPLARNELRFFLPEAVAAIRQEALGLGADCRASPAGTLCTRDQPNPLPPAPVPPGFPVPLLPAGTTQAGQTLTPYLAFGWAQDSLRTAWSEGPQSTLLFRLPPGPRRNIVLDMTLDTVARSPGGTRDFTVRIDDAPPTAFSFPDLQRAHVALPLPADLSPGAVRIVFQVRRPVAPEKRGLLAPVRRAGVRVYAIGLLAG